jgi:hypothetical protein
MEMSSRFNQLYVCLWSSTPTNPINVTANAVTLITNASEVAPNHSKLTQDSIFDYDDDDFHDDSYDSTTSRDDILTLVHQAQLITTADNTNDSPHHLHFPPWSITTPRKAYSEGYSSAQVENRGLVQALMDEDYSQKIRDSAKPSPSLSKPPSPLTLPTIPSS